MKKEENVAMMQPVVGLTSTKDIIKSEATETPKIDASIKTLIDNIISVEKKIEELSKDNTKKVEVLELKQRLAQDKNKLTHMKEKLSKDCLAAVKEYQKTVVSESYDIATQDFKRGKLEELKKELDYLKAQPSTDENDEKKRDLQSKIDELETDIKTTDIEDGANELVTEAKDMEKEIVPIVEKLNKKGYKVKYASPGHPNIRKKGDNDKDGVYYGRLYSDARIMFDKKYKFPSAPDLWHWRDVDGCSYLDITPLKPEKYSDVDGELKKWKDNYMKSLTEYVNNLPDAGKATDNKKEDNKDDSKKDENKDKEKNEVTKESYDQFVESVRINIETDTMKDFDISSIRKETKNPDDALFGL